MSKKMTTEEFLIRAEEIHGDLYDYSYVEYLNTGTPVRIICPKHGEFMCSPRNHLRPEKPRGCPKCGRDRQIKFATKPFDEFVSVAKKIHYGRYQYIPETYARAKSNMTMICAEHGEFRQTPDSHLRGAGCPTCAGETRAKKYRDSHASAVAQLVASQSDGKVMLDATSYRGQNAGALFNCKQHGNFERRVILALKTTHPCPECLQIALDTFPQEAESLKAKVLSALGENYTVEPFEFDGRGTKMTLQCGDPEHPPFARIISSTFRLRGCPVCGNQSALRHRQEALARLAKATRNDRFDVWRAEALEIHGTKFDYSEVEYRRAREKVKIGCPVHGSFWQTPADHLAGGCRKCADEDQKGAYSKVFFQRNQAAGLQPALLYYLGFHFDEVSFFKVGVTINDVAKRHAMLNTLSGLEFDTLAEGPMTLLEAYEAEQYIQTEHGDHSRGQLPFPKEVQRRIRIGHTECFFEQLSKSLLEKYFV